MERDYTDRLMLGCGSLIRALRERRGVTQRELGLRLGLSRSRITRLESGDGHMSLLLLVRIAHALDGSLLDILPPESVEVNGTSPEDLCRILARLHAQTDHIVRQLCGMFPSNHGNHRE